MLLAVAIVVLKGVALLFQRIARFIFNLPPRPSSPHQFVDVALTHSQVRHPTEVWDLVLTHFPVLDDMNPHIRSRCLEWHVVHKAKPMHKTRGTVVPLIMGHATLLLGRLHLCEQIGMVACFPPEDGVTTG